MSNVKYTIVGRAPVRVDFFGGWTDLSLFTELMPGCVLNAAITLYTYATVRPSPPRELDVSLFGYNVREQIDSESVCPYSADFDEYISVRSVADIEYNGTMDLVKAACKRFFSSHGGFEIVTRSEAPPGSGLGTSASLGVAVIGALAAYAMNDMLPSEVADLAYRLEVEDLGLLSGTQDQYSAAYGGISFLKCMGEMVSRSAVEISGATRLELEKRCVLVYTGTSRLSSKIHEHVRGAFERGENHSALRCLVEAAVNGRKALREGNLEMFGELMSVNWSCQKQLHPTVTNDTIDGIINLALRSGAVGGKACGAGGGGCLLFLAKSGEEHVLRKALVANGLDVLNFHIDETGLRVWRYP